MSARACPIAHAVLTLALLLAAQTLTGLPVVAAAGETTAIQPLIQTGVDQFPRPPVTVSIARVIFTPAASDNAESFPGLRLLFVESGSLTLHATGTIPIVHIGPTGPANPTATATAAPTPTPAPSPVTDVILGPGDGIPVPIWTMHSLRNNGPDPAVVIDVRIAPDDAPGLSTNLDAETLAREGGLMTLPTGAAAVTLGRGTMAPDGLVAAPQAGAYQLVAAASGDGQLERNADGSVHNTGTAAQDVYVVKIAPVAAAAPRQPPPPTTGPGSDDTAYPAARAAHIGSDPGGSWLWEPVTGTGQSAPVAAGPFPVLIYLGGGGGNLGYSDPQTQDPWMKHLARQGYVVVAPVYNTATVMRDIRSLLPQALAELATPGHAAVDLSGVAVLGYSFGAPWTVLYAATAATAGLPVPQAIYVDSPCEGDPCATVPPDLVLPRGVKVVVLSFADDDWGFAAANRVWQGLSSVPLADRDFVTMVTDRHGQPPALARHDATFNAIDAADYYGIWKLSDALFACAFRGKWCEYALGNTPEQRSMGTWSDGVPVAALRVTDDPTASAVAATPEASPTPEVASMFQPDLPPPVAVPGAVLMRVVTNALPLPGQTYVGAVRSTWAPGAADVVPVDIDGPRLDLVESGTLTVHLDDGAAWVVRAATPGTPVPDPPSPERVEAPTDIVLHPGDWIAIPAHTAHHHRNDGTEPLTLLDLTAATPWTGANVSGEEDIFLAATFSTFLPTTPATFALSRVVLDPGATLPAAPTGTLQVAGPNSGNGDDVVQEADGSIRNPGTAPVVVMVITLAPTG
jgi:mannose-6-phosphate isomerase-like protein (cupin superfamily)